ncbi:glycoside hydrolase family 65 protein [Candidatus Omnitrophota bacterium]
MKDFISQYASRADWLLWEKKWNKDLQGTRETQFTIGNGYICSRGALEEIPYDALPGTFMAGVFDKSGAQIPEIVNLPNPFDFKIIVQGEKMDVASMDVVDHKRVLDMKQGILFRKTIFANARKQRFAYQSMRFLSMDDVHIGGLQACFIPLDGPAEIIVQNIVDTGVVNKGLLTEGSKKHVQVMNVSRSKEINYTCVRTFESKISIGFADTFFIDDTTKTWQTHDRAIKLKVDKGKSVCFTKLFSVHSTREVLLKDLKTQVRRSLSKAIKLGFHAVVNNHRAAFSRKWQISDIVVKPDKNIQQAVRFNIYHLLILGNDRGKDTSIGAKGLAGEGYRGHIFWDAEIFILPFFLYNNSIVAKNMLLYRYNRLSASRKNAAKNGYRGTQFAWESADSGEETTPSWHKLQDGSIIKIYTGQQEHHIVADVAYAVDHYCNVTGDGDFMATYGLEIMFETARFWASRVELDKRKKYYEIRHVIGPDEFCENINNNAFTNAMARWNLLRAVELYRRYVQEQPAALRNVTKKIGLREAELNRWRSVGKRMYIPFSKKHNLIEQCEGYFKKRNAKITSYDKNGMPLLPKGVSERKLDQTQLIKQADVVMLLYLLSNTFTLEQKRLNYHYYIQRTTHRSSLSASINAIIGAEVGDLERAFTLFTMALYTDIRDVHGNSLDGIHSACLGGVWQVLVKGFGGLRMKRNMLTFDPKLPRKISLLEFSVLWRDYTLHVSVQKNKIKLCAESSSQEQCSLIVYKKVHEIPCNKTVTFSKKGR